MTTTDKTRDYAARLAGVIGATIVPNPALRDRGVTLMTKVQVPLMVFHRTKTMVELQIDWPMYLYADKFTGAVRARDVMNKAEWKREEEIYAAQGFWSHCLRFTESRPAEGFVANEVNAMVAKFTPHYQRAVELMPSIAQKLTEQHVMEERYSRASKNKEVMLSLLHDIADCARPGNADALSDIRERLRAAGFGVEPLI